jgi:uncharacterized NAD-dependent epimerase/dehydratase family protein
MRGLAKTALPSLTECIALNQQCGRLTNPSCRVIGVSVNTAALDESEAERMLKKVEDDTGLVAVDAYRSGAGRLVDALG